MNINVAIIDILLEKFSLLIFIAFIIGVVLLSGYCSQRERKSQKKEKPRYPDFEMDQRTF